MKGIEPSTCCLASSRSDLLSYIHVGAVGSCRLSDLRGITTALYTELQQQVVPEGFEPSCAGL